MRFFKRAFWFTLATLFLIEAWLWDVVQPVVRQIVERLPLRRIKAFFRWLVARLPAWAALFVMGLPSIVLIPAKIAGLWLLAHGHIIAGAGLFVVAKSAGVFLVVFLFEVCRPKLMQMAWFAQVYAWFERARMWAHAQMAPFKLWIQSLKQRAFGGSTGFGQKLSALRRRIRP